MPATKIYIIAGEASGDLHGANLIKALKEKLTMLKLRVWGGDKMKSTGADLVKHYKDMAFMGFWEVAKNYGVIRKNLKLCQQDILSFKPDVLILIDYAGFNLRIARFAKKHNIKVAYYISPKVWAWNQSRAYNIKQVVDQMYVILPFEKDFYSNYDYSVKYVGNPLLDAIRDFNPNPDFLNKWQIADQQNLVAVLPGSRKQEVENMLRGMLDLADRFRHYHFVVAAVSSLPPSLYKQAENRSNVSVVWDDSYNLLHNAHAALVTSGTATLETALFNVPQLVCYKTSFISYHIAKLLIKIPFISLVNLIAGKEVVKELIQHEFNVNRLELELKEIMYGERRTQILKDYADVRHILGDYQPSKTLAQAIISDFELKKG